MTRIVCVLCIFVATVPALAAGAFPGAEGWGAETAGGRGGQIIFVTSLADSGPGTLREALNTKGPRTVLFRVSGVIRLDSIIAVGAGHDPADGDNPWSHLTVAGQSAPGGGITISGREVYFGGGIHDVIIRNLRFRGSRKTDCLGLDGASRVVIDHCSFSWATDENLGVKHASDVTISWCIIAEGLMHGGHSSGHPNHSCGALVSYGADRVSLHHNYWAHNRARNPALYGTATAALIEAGEPLPEPSEFDLRNNLVYNWVREGVSFGSGALVNIVSNVFVPGPSTPADMPGIRVYADLEDGTRAFVADNQAPAPTGEGQWAMVHVGYPREGETLPLFGAREERYRADAPVNDLAIATDPATDVADRVPAGAGAWPRDATDARLAAEFRARTGAQGAPDRTHETPFPPPEPGEPDEDGDADGMPDRWEVERGLDPADATDAWADRDGDGWPNLEEYLTQRHDESRLAR